LDTKYPFVTHSELNAILNFRGGSLEGTTLYVSLFPCNECAKAIIQAGIKEVVYDSDKYNNTPTNIAAKKMFEAAGVKCVQYKKSGRKIVLEV
jgi:dCMP deaminase